MFARSRLSPEDEEEEGCKHFGQELLLAAVLKDKQRREREKEEENVRVEPEARFGSLGPLSLSAKECVCHDFFPERVSGSCLSY
jgi:hypothetical protein